MHDAGLETPTWREMSESLPERVSQPEPNGPKFGWQHAANRTLEEQFHAAHWEELPPPDKALLRSQCGPLASAALTALPTCRATLSESQPFPRLVVPSPSSPHFFTSRNCRCGRRLDKFGHHRAACSRVRVLGREVFRWSSDAQVCREAGGRVATNVLIRDLDLGEFNAFDSRRVEVIADGLTLWQGAQLAIDTTLPLRGDGSARPRAADHNGAALEAARRRKEAIYPELARGTEGGRLVVLAAEVGGRWSTETAQFLRGLAKAQVEVVPMILQDRAKAARMRRWSSMLACSVVRAFSESLLERRPVPRTGNVPLTHEVMREDRF